MAVYVDAYAKAVAKNDTSKATKAPKVTKTPKTEIADNAEEPLPTGEVKDGTYHVQAVCSPDADRDFSAYTLSADVVFKQKKCTEIKNLSSDAEENRTYYLKAANGSKGMEGIVEQILKKQSVSGIYAVSGATCSSKTIRTLYLLALAQATGMEKTEEEELATEVIGEVYADFLDKIIKSDSGYRDHSLLSGICKEASAKSDGL